MNSSENLAVKSVSVIKFVECRGVFEQGSIDVLDAFRHEGEHRRSRSSF